MKLIINGKKRSFNGPPFKRLIDVLRQDFGLTGTKEGCGEGECGACTVLINEQPVNSCLIPVIQVEGAKIQTVESLGKPEALNPLQQSFLKEGGSQCGICTPGMLMTCTALKTQHKRLTRDKAQQALAGNLCRCTGYEHILNSVLRNRKISPKS